MALGDVAENGQYDTGDSGRRRRIEMAPLNKELQEQIGEHDACGGKQHVAEELNPFTKIGLRKDYVPGKYKAQRETDTESYDVGCDMGADRPVKDVNVLLIYYEVVADKVEEYIK
jgi:hypothetical protein